MDVFHEDSGVGDSLVTSKRVRNLGTREREVLEILWKGGDATVQQVADRLKSRLAYTTIMTTLDRLFKKGLLLREKVDRAFVYRPALSPSDLEKHRASALVDRFFSASAVPDDLLVSCLIEAVQQYDENLLEQLEAKIQTTKRSIAFSNPQSEKK